jgi:hypothetical protein
MIHLSFHIGNVFDNYFKRYFCKNYEITKNKNLEIELVRCNTIFGFNFMWTVKGHHAGIHSSISILSYNFSVVFYDRRHWDYKKQIWLEN